MKYKDARSIGDEVVEALRPYCERVELAGSVRRLKAEVKDIEVVCVPRMTPQLDLWGNQVGTVSALDYSNSWHADVGVFSMAKNGKRYKQAVLAANGKGMIKLDLFLAIEPAQWGVAMVIRTGPAEFSKWCVTKRAKGGGMPTGFYEEGLAVWPEGEKKPLRMDEEIDYLDFLGMGWINPEERAARWWK